MTNPAAQPGAGVAAAGGHRPLTALAMMREFGDRWAIAHNGAVWSAERRSPDGRHRRFLAAHRAGELADLIEAAEAEEAEAP